MGFDKNRRPSFEPRSRLAEESYYKFPTASSAGASVGPRGAFVLLPDTSAGGAAPKVIYLATPKLGDYIECYLGQVAATSNGVFLRTSSSGTFVGTTAHDGFLLTQPGFNVCLRAYSSGLWLNLGTTAGLTASTS